MSLFPAGWGEKIIEKGGDNCPVCVVGRKLENDGIHVTLILLVLTAFIFIPFNTLRWNFRRQRETSYPSVDPIKCNEKERADCFPQIVVVHFSAQLVNIFSTL